MILPWIVLGLLLLAPRAAAQDPEETDLNKLRERIEKTRREVENLKGEESGILNNLMKLDEDLGLTNRLLTGLESKRKQVEAGLGELEREAKDAESELDRRRRLLRTRLRALYQFGGYHEFEVLLGSQSVVDLVTRFDRLLRVVRRDDTLYRSVLDERVRLETARGELLSREEEIRRIEEERSRERSVLLRRKQDRRDLLGDVRNRRESHEKMVAELEEAEKELERIIASRMRQGGGEYLGPSLLEGGNARLPWPVDGRVVREFGKTRHPEFGTEVTNNGIDIGAPMGTDILCVAPGRVEYVSTLPGYGNCIIVAHGGGYYTLYAHAAEIRVSAGERVEQGRVLGTVGNTGSVSGSSLHFEIRQGTKPLDPSHWLR
ncbi:MAG: peptidoglycan DD-metalloendopeptidase family protein [Candidatus Eisenbacteria bacterium]